MASPEVDHRFHSEHHAGFQHQSGIWSAVMQYLRVFVEYPADTVPAVFAHYAAIIFFSMLLDGIANIAKAHARPDHFNTDFHALVGDA